MIFFKYARIWLKSQLIYKWSFLLLSIGQFFVPFFVFIGLVLMFSRFETLSGWAFQEVALIFGTTHMAFAITECLVRGFDSFSTLVVSGDFDRLLLRPLPTAIQVLGSKFEFTRIGRLIQGMIVLGYALVMGDITWTPLKIICLLGMILGGIAIYSGLMIIFATMSFWTIEGLEIANIFTDGGREMSQYPLVIYARPIRKFFTYVVPFAVVNYVPLMYLLGRDGYTQPFNAFIPFLAILFLIPSIALWNIGVKHYKSTGS